MKKLLVLLLITLLTLCSCETGAGDPSGDTSEFSSAADEVSENSAEEDYFPVGKEELLAKAKELVENDITLMGIFAGGALSNGENSKKYTAAKFHGGISLKFVFRIAGKQFRKHCLAPLFVR